jgi:sugar/nucleoside kinase (ribokinase family)
MTAQYDVVAIGNAIVDVLASTTEAFLEAENLPKGSMRLIDADRAVELYARMGPAREISGGAAANTLAGMATLGAKCAFIGQVADDQLGDAFTHDLRAAGVSYDVPPLAGKEPTARCLILVTEDGQRTMNTALGASHSLPASAIDTDLIANASILLLEGYLWDPPEPRAAMRRAIAHGRAANTKIALATCADFCVNMHGADFRSLIADGQIDMLFANEEELMILGESDLETAITTFAPQVETLVVTCGPDGAMAIRDGERFEVKAEPVAKVIDTTGAGDLFAGGFLAGHTQGRSIEDCLTMGAICAGEIISHWGPRPEADLKALVAARLG